MRQRQTQVRLFVWSPQSPATTKRTTTCGNVCRRRCRCCLRRRNEQIK
ncbi:hypothetical protein ISN45_Aa07g026640, partial [Arabidopsis thaliana x Arabidopsis arenosa]